MEIARRNVQKVSVSFFSLPTIHIVPSFLVHGNQCASKGGTLLRRVLFSVFQISPKLIQRHIFKSWYSGDRGCFLSFWKEIFVLKNGFHRIKHLL